MRNWRRVSAALVLAAAFLACCLCVSGGPVRAGDDGARFLLFSGGDIWRNGDFAYGGLLWSPDGLDNNGFTLKAVMSGGFYRYNSGALGDVQVTGRELVVQVLPGWRFKHDRLELKVFAGLDLEDHRLVPDDPSSRLRGSDIGARAAVDIWYEPTPGTMLAADGSISTIITSYSARIAYGWRAFDLFYFGPEAQTFACDGYRQLRFGVHLTSFKTGDAEWSAAAGWSDDSDRRTSVYFRFGVLTRR
jgi:Cellulose biosynthesis protein BcsS